MNPERLKQIESLLDRAFALEPVARGRFLDEACSGDPNLRADLESLIVSDERAEQEEGVVRRAIHGLVGELAGEYQSLPLGTRIGPYEIVRELGRGGMGAVYLAERADEAYRKKVAIKLIKRGMDTDDVLRRFLHERQILANLDHPNIARLLDGGATPDGRPYFVMEYVEGLPVHQHCAALSLSIPERLKLFRTVCSAVHYAHQNLVVHRDLKPSNIVVAAGGVPKLLDFGVAKVLHPDSPAHGLTVTAAGLRPLTPEYASPEQVRGEAITTAADVYSLGIVLCELLTGRRPDGAGPVSGQAFRISRDLDNIIRMATREEPQRRYASVEQFSEDIRRHLEGLPVIARKDTLGYRAGKFVSRHKAGVAAVAVVLAMIVGFAVTTAVQAARIARERDRAVAAEELAERRQSEAEAARDSERAQRQLAESNLARAEEAEGRATAEAVRARSEAETARRVSEFLVNMFEVADPGRSKGNTITAREILDTSAARIAKELKDQPTVQATLMDTMGRVYESLGLYASAEPLHEEALRLRRQTLGARHAGVAQSMHNLAQVLRRKSEFAKAESLYREALEMQRALLGPEHPDVAETLDNLALALTDQGRYEAAEALYRESLAMRRKLLGPEHPDVAESLNNLGLVLWKKGNHQAAEPLHRQALAMWRKLLGEDHPKVAISLDNLALVLQARGDQEGAERLHREALAIFRKLHGPEHPDLATNLNNLAVFLFRKGDYDGAEPLYREALAMQRKLLGDEHFDVALSLINLATLLKAKGDYDAAEPLFRQSVATFRKVHGDEHPNVSRAITTLARFLHDKGDLAAAEPLYREASELNRKLLPEGHRERAPALLGLGQLLTSKGTPRDAEPLLREGLAIRRKTLPEGHWLTAEAQSLLGGCLAALQRYEEAEPLLVESYAALKASRGERNSATQDTLTRLIELYNAWGKPGEAGQYRALLPQPDSR